MEVAIFVFVVTTVVALYVTAPLRPGASSDERIEDSERAELEARKLAKYREIRDAELDHEQGKLSREDWARADAELRRDAIEILREIDAYEQRRTGSSDPGG